MKSESNRVILAPTGDSGRKGLEVRVEVVWEGEHVGSEVEFLFTVMLVNFSSPGKN